MAAAVVAPSSNVPVVVVGGGVHGSNKPAPAAAAMNMDTFARVDSVMRDDDNDNAKDNKVDDSGSGASSSAKLKTAVPTTPIKTTIPAAANGNDVRVVQLSEWKAAAMCLAEAFADDDMAMYFLNTPDRAHWSKEQKWALHVKIMEYVTYAHLLKGLVVTAGPNYDCVALWMPPGQNMDDMLTIFRSGMWRLNYELSSEGKKRFFTEFLPLLHDTKAQILGARDPSSWYLVYIGTKPTSRGKGYARKVIDHVTRLADEQGRACYLESSNAVNRKIYGRMGFELQKQIFLQRAEVNVELDIMVREAAGGTVKKPVAK